MCVYSLFGTRMYGEGYVLLETVTNNPNERWGSPIAYRWTFLGEEDKYRAWLIISLREKDPSRSTREYKSNHRVFHNVFAAYLKFD